jgi:putative ABC transport system ATP-binding protein
VAAGSGGSVVSAALDVRDLRLTFNPGQINEARALQGVDLTVERGQFVVILGSNGAGKSTLMNAVAGVHQPDSGTVHLDGKDLTGVADHRRARHIGRVFQDPMAGTAGTLTIEENLVLAERRNGRRRLRVPHGAEHHRELLRQLGMGLEDRLSTRVDTLSGGQRQAMAVLMAIQADPSLLMLDEHTAALDPAAAERVLDVTTRLASQTHITTLMITHNMSHAIELGDRTVMMHRGRILFDLDAEERAGLTLPDLIDRFRQLAADELSDRTALT